MKKLLNIAYKQLKLLEKVQEPTADTYQQMANLVTCVEYLQKCYSTQKSELSTMIEDIKSTLGEARALELLEEVITEFINDLNTVSPHLSKCFTNKLKEKLQ